MQGFEMKIFHDSDNRKLREFIHTYEPEQFFTDSFFRHVSDLPCGRFIEHDGPIDIGTEFF